MRSTADLISGFVASRSTRKVRSCRPSCDSSFATSAFSVMTGALMTSQIVLIRLRRLLFLRVLFLALSGRSRSARLLRVERGLQLLRSRARHDEFLMVEHVVDVHAACTDDLRAFDVSRGEQEVIVVNRVNDERLAFESKRRNRLDELFRLRPAE